MGNTLCSCFRRNDEKPPKKQGKKFRRRSKPGYIQMKEVSISMC